MGSTLPVIDAPSVASEATAPRSYEPLPTGGPESYGYGAGTAVQEAGMGFMRLQRAADMEVVNTRLAEVSKWRNQNIDDPDTGALSARELNAQGITKKYTADFDKFAGTLREGLNERQRTLLDRYLNTQKMSISRTLGSHELAQMTKAGDAGHVAALSLLKNSAAASVQTGGDPNQMLADGIEMINNRAPLAGWKEPQRELELLKFRTDLHARVIDSFGNRYAEAQKYLDAHRKEMADDVAGDFDRRLAAGARAEADKTEAYTAWEGILGQSTNSATGRFNPLVAQELLDGMPAEQKGKLYGTVHQLINQAREDQHRVDVEKIASLEKVIYATKGRVLDRSLPAYQYLDTAGQAAADGIARRAQRELRSEGREDRAYQSQANQIAVNEFLSEQDAPNWGTMTREEMAAKWPEADDQAFSRMTRYQAADRIEKAKGATIKRADVGPVVNNFAKNLPAEARAKLTAEMMDWWSERIEDKPKMEEFKAEVASRVAVYGKVWFQGTGIEFTAGKRRGTQLTPEQRASYPLKSPEDQDVPVARDFAAKKAGAKPEPKIPKPGENTFKHSDGKTYTTRIGPNGAMQYRVKRGGKSGWDVTIKPGDTPAE